MHIVIADDEFCVGLAVRCLLQQEAYAHQISEVRNASQLLAYLANACPDLILLDWELPGLPIPVLLRACCPHTKVIALSVRPEARAEALRLGADGFVSKGDPPEKLLLAVRQLALI